MNLQSLSDYPAIRKYLNEQRHLTDEMIADARIGVAIDDKGREWIAFPLEEGVKLRAAPSNDSPAKGRYMEEGTKAQLYYGETLSPDMQQVVICEGEIDCLLLNQLGFNAVSSTSGAGTFYESWVMRLPQDCDCVLCFDNDEAGHQGREKVRELIRQHRRDIRIFDLRFGKDKPKGYDVSDCVHELTTARGLTMEQIADVLKQGIRVWREEIAGSEGYERPIAEVQRPVEDVTYEQWMARVKELFPALATATECCASVIAQLLVQDTTNCFGLILVDVPSSGKTICLNFFTGCEELVYTSDDFSPAALVSHAAQKKAKDLQGIDMLPKIRFKTLLLREMAAVFGDKDDDLRKKMHLLTRVMDGEGLETESGVHGKRGYQGDYLFMLLGASTPIALRVWKVMGGAGHRLFFLSLNSKRLGVDELHDILRDGSFKRKEVAMRQMTHDFLRTLWRKNPHGIRWDTANDDPKATEWIARLAHFVAHYRGEILVYSAWSDGEDGGGGKKELQHTRPQIEQPTRVMTLLYGLARGRAALEGRSHITIADLAPVIRLALDTAPDPRPLMLRELLIPDHTQPDSRRNVTAQVVAESMKCAVNTAKKEMEKLIVLGIAKNVHGFEQVEDPVQDDIDDVFGAVSTTRTGGTASRKELSLADEYKWLVSEEFRTMCREIGVILPGEDKLL